MYKYQLPGTSILNRGKIVCFYYVVIKHTEKITHLYVQFHFLKIKLFYNLINLSNIYNPFPLIILQKQRGSLKKLSSQKRTQLIMQYGMGWL